MSACKLLAHAMVLVVVIPYSFFFREQEGLDPLRKKAIYSLQIQDDVSRDDVSQLKTS